MKTLLGKATKAGITGRPWSGIRNPRVLGGYALMGLSLLVNIFAMSHGIQVKEVSSIESLSYLFVPLLSLACFKEKITLRKALSIAIILIGIFIFFR